MIETIILERIIVKLNQSNQYIKRVKLLNDDIPSKNEYPFCLPAIESLTELPLHPQVTYIVGENGMGKSTLIEAIAISAGFNPEGGSFNFNFSTHDSHSELEQYLRLIKGVLKPKDGFFLRAESFYNVATNIEELDNEPGGPRVIDQFGGVSLHEQSHGESFFAAFTNRFKGKGLYIMDEPEAALSPLRQLSMLSRINELVSQSSQFIIATHSPIIMAYPDALLYEFTREGIKKTTLENTEHFRLMKQFFDDKERMLFHLFKH
ncbi:ATP-binding cassette domain-containing protein [Siminovitchia terrae]|uniref:ATP-binding cassette domain-containing protein n=1 Tax=Siminovitchia terrae TaxID=1914933 RepID=A0A429X291_SIMTE|nr:ATP-binding cassette domain-containing protein [Siminovitchia terrae]